MLHHIHNSSSYVKITLEHKVTQQLYRDFGSDLFQWNHTV